jgi:hypothetical protein
LRERIDHGNDHDREKRAPRQERTERRRRWSRPPSPTARSSIPIDTKTCNKTDGSEAGRRNYEKEKEAKANIKSGPSKEI